MIHLFHFELSGTFPIVKNNYLQLVITFLNALTAFERTKQHFTLKQQNITCQWNIELHLVLNQYQIVKILQFKKMLKLQHQLFLQF